MDKQKQLELLSKRIAAFYKKDDGIKVCACLGGWECQDLSCPIVWEFLLSNPGKLSGALELFYLAETLVNNKLLSWEKKKLEAENAELRKCWKCGQSDCNHRNLVAIEQAELLALKLAVD